MAYLIRRNPFELSKSGNVSLLPTNFYNIRVTYPEQVVFRQGVTPHSHGGRCV